MNRRQKKKGYCESITKILEERPVDDGNGTEYLVSFHDTFEPLKNISKQCYEMFYELEPSLRDTIQREQLDEVGDDNIEASENEIHHWAVDRIAAVRKNKNVSIDLPDKYYSKVFLR